MSEEWIETNGGLAMHRNNYDESGMPAGIEGMVMPGEMAACSEHNAKEQWRAEHEPGYVPHYKHPKVVPYTEPQIDRDADRSGFNGLVDEAPQIQKPEPAPAPEAPEETHKEEPAEGLVPDTMPGIWKLLGFTAESFYDLGTRTLSPAGKKPSLDASLKTYRRNMLLTVARALLLKEYDRKFTAEQVRKSAIAAWKNNGRMKKYSDVIRENQGPATMARLKAIIDEVDGFISGKVKCEAKYMIPYLGQLWCLKGFILWCKTTRNLALKKTGWRTEKKD